MLQERTFVELILLILLIFFLGYSLAYNKNQSKTKIIDIDEKVSVEDYKKSKEILNSVDLETISTRDALNQIVDKLAEIDNSKFRDEVKKVDFNILKTSLIEMRDCINSMDLDSKTAISTRELYQGKLTDEEMKRAENKVNGVNKPKQSFFDYYLNPENAGIYDINADEDFITDSDSKSRRIKKKRDLLTRLEREHGFAMGYAPNWDSSEGLYAKYNDEEKYLDAKIEEVKQKNLSYDMYLTEDEKRIYKDDISPDYWE